MDLLILLRDARVAGLRLAAREDRLQVIGPPSAAGIARALGECKEEVLALLEAVSALTGAAPGPKPQSDDPAAGRDAARRTSGGRAGAHVEAKTPPSIPGTIPTGAGPARGRPDYPWRAVLPVWPIAWRERWGRRANQLAEAGVPWPEDERRAFAEVAAEREAAGPGTGASTE